MATRLPMIRGLLIHTILSLSLGQVMFSRIAFGQDAGRIGAVLARVEDRVEITELIPNSSAATSGRLEAGDWIVAVSNDLESPVDVSQSSLADVIKLIHGEVGTSVKLTVVRKGMNRSDAFDVILVRTPITAKTLETLEGSWKLQHYEVNGKKSEYNSWEVYGIYKEGASWHLKPDGSADCGGTECKWSFDAAKKKMNIQIKNLFGYWVTSISDADVALQTNAVHVSCEQFGHSVKFILKPELASQLQIADSGTVLEVSDGVIDREVFTEIIETVPGLPKKLTVSREYETTVSSVITVGSEIEAGVKLGPKMLAQFSAELRAKLEVALGITLGKKDQVTETYELDGDRIVKVKIKWIERYKKGSMKLHDGTTKDFMVCIGLRTKPELIR